MTSASAARAYVETMDARDWAAWTPLLHEDVVYELPQTRERIRGRDGLLAFNTAYPGDWRLTADVVVADEDGAAVRMGWRDGDQSGEAQVFLELGPDGRITKVTDFWPEPYDPPERVEGPLERY